MKCCICKKEFDDGELYEYRGAIACAEHFEQAQKERDIDRAEIIEDAKHRTEKFRGIDLSDSAIGKANREILRADIEIAKKESGRRKAYEQREAQP